MYDADEEPTDPEERPAYDWDAWEKNRFSGRGRLWMILMVAVIIALTIQFFQSGGDAIPWGPPG